MEFSNFCGCPMLDDGSMRVDHRSQCFRLSKLREYDPRKEPWWPQAFWEWTYFLGFSIVEPKMARFIFDHFDKIGTLTGDLGKMAKYWYCSRCHRWNTSTRHSWGRCRCGAAEGPRSV